MSNSLNLDTNLYETIHRALVSIDAGELFPELLQDNSNLNKNLLELTKKIETLNLPQVLERISQTLLIIKEAFKTPTLVNYISCTEARDLQLEKLLAINEILENLLSLMSVKNNEEKFYSDPERFCLVRDQLLTTLKPLHTMIISANTEIKLGRELLKKFPQSKEK